MTTTTEAIYTPGVYDSIDDATYHADPIPGGSLSSTSARQLLRSAAHYQYALTHRTEKRAYDVGHAVHAKVLGVGMDVDVYEHDSWRTNAAKVDRDASYAAGRVPMLADDYAPVLAMTEAVLAHPIARDLLTTPGLAEQSAFAIDPSTGVWLRARFDYLPHASSDETVIVDLKTSWSADPRAFGRSAADFGYDVQAEWYQHVLRLARGDRYTSFRFVVVASEPPHLVSVIELDDEFAAIGRARMRRAIDLYVACKAGDEWPGYNTDTHLVGAPGWLASQEGKDIAWT